MSNVVRWNSRTKKNIATSTQPRTTFMRIIYSVKHMQSSMFFAPLPRCYYVVRKFLYMPFSMPSQFFLLQHKVCIAEAD